jgi:hypothetical protein
MPERRYYPRKKMVLPVKLSVSERHELAHTIDISVSGARLGGLRAALQLGETINLNRNGRKASFRIVWIREMGPNEMQVGIEATQVQETFWGVDLSAEHDGKKDVEALMSLLARSKK